MFRNCRHTKIYVFIHLLVFAKFIPSYFYTYIPTKTIHTDKWLGTRKSLRQLQHKQVLKIAKVWSVDAEYSNYKLNYPTS